MNASPAIHGSGTAAAPPSPRLEIPPPPPGHAFRWRKVFRLLRELRHAEDPVQAGLELFEAVGGMDGERSFQRFAGRPEGRRMLRARADLVSRLGDRAALAALPDGSLGREYLAFCERNGFAADSILEKNRAIARESRPLDPYRCWFWDRISVTHDLWHVLTGCPTTPEGETRLLWFTYAQDPTRGLRVILMLVTHATGLDPGRHRAHWRSWRAGRRARELSVAPWEELLERPLDEVRRRLDVPELMAC